MKKLYCSRCSKFLCEIEKGRIKKGTVLICENCNDLIIALETSARSRSAKVDNPDFMPDFMRGIFTGGK